MPSLNSCGTWYCMRSEQINSRTMTHLLWPVAPHAAQEGSLWPCGHAGACGPPPSTPQGFCGHGPCGRTATRHKQQTWVCWCSPKGVDRQRDLTATI
eukprot:969716-Pelagomonas_calceolata.AAC.10